VFECVQKVVKLIKTADDGDQQLESLHRNGATRGILDYSRQFGRLEAAKGRRCAGKAAGEVVVKNAL
jgi:hypothetical protein